MQFQPDQYRWLRQAYLASLMNSICYPTPIQLTKMQLCQALKRDFDRFYLQSLQNKTKHSTKIDQIKEPEEKKTQIIELSSQGEESNQQTLKTMNKKRKQSNLNKTHDFENEQKTDLSKDHGQNKIQQPFSQQQHSSNSMKKTVLIRKQKKEKIKSKTKKGLYRRLQSKIDFEETVQIKNLPLSLQELIRKRESLQLRHVANWEQANRGRKERREIRMLKN